MNRLRELRENRDMLQKDVAKFLKISTSAYGFYETDKREMSATTAKKLADFFNVSVDYLLGEDKNDKKLLPVLGVVKAGYNYLAQQNVIDYIEPGKDITDIESYFGLLVVGDSMSPQFDDGDYVVVKKTDGEFDSGKVCVVLINEDEGTVKKVIKTDAGIELHAFNPYYPVQKYAYKEMQEKSVKIIGTVVRQIRNWK